MSGFEVAGVVLGVLPLVIDALAEYREGKGALSTLLKFKGLLDDLIHQLSTQKTAFYLDILQLLREAKVPEILDDIDPPESRCISVLKDAQTDVKLQGKSDPPLTVEVPPRQAAKDDLDAIIRASSDPHGISLAKGRFKFAIDRKSLDALVKDLRTERYSLGKLLKRVKTQRDWEARQPSKNSTKMARLFAQVQVGAASLYKAACQCWTCDCQHQHTIMVRLENRIVNLSAQPAHIIFRVCFPTEETLIQEAEVRARAKELQLGDTGNWQIEPSHFDGLGSHNGASPAISVTASCSDGTSYQTTSVRVTNICEEAREARRRGQALALELTADALNLREEIARSKQSFKSTTTLKDFLAAASQNHDARMTPKQQSLLALDVATAVLQLQRTPWSGIPWNNQTIKFLVEGNGAVEAWAPIVEQTIQPTTTLLPAQPLDPEPVTQTTKKTVLELAILMLEILQHKSLETWAAETGQGATTKFSERLQAAIRWLELSDDKLLPHHLNAVEACLFQCVRRNSSWNIEFQRLFCENIVQPLQQLVMPLRPEY
ncbi:hypothetical protein CFIO01_12955 [Colletotrichum fioriniae PJ7]|uniref:DUF7580 domain-containing protein n=1 Tax=Colletotrichum fioriniae PJ7 TaxID=1445577 RepID=A0A010QSJ0_9PEZI|nr:hypothetical protein CFIO01_12955 [Colletotrichum fioriniae PJ7]